MKTKQVIVVRKDLNMRKGKLAAQVAHASMKAILDRMFKMPAKHKWLEHVWDEWSISILQGSPLYDWLTDKFTKIVVYVNSEEELMDLYIEAQKKNILHALIQDAGLTEFKEPTYTCIAIGPDKNEVIDEITGGLPLL